MEKIGYLDQARTAVGNAARASTSGEGERERGEKTDARNSLEIFGELDERGRSISGAGSRWHPGWVSLWEAQNQ